MSSWFPTRIDPYVGNFVERFALLLKDEYEITCLHTQGDRTLKSIEVEEQTENGVRYIRVYHPVSKNKLAHWWNQRASLRRGLNRIDHIDLLFAHVFLPRAYQFEKVQRYFHCPLIVLEHGSYFRKAARKKLHSYQRRQIKSLSRHTKQILAVSEVLRKDMQPMLPTTPIEVIPNFIDASLFRIRKNLPDKLTRFIHISTLDPQTKNPDLLFQGFLNAYLSSNKCISLTIVSDQNTDKWERWCKQNNCREAVHFTGPKEWHEINELLHAHHALLITSVYETFNIVLAEAWYTGTPVISTSVGIATDLLPELGVQLRKNQIAELKQAILGFANGDYSFKPEVIHEYAKRFESERVKTMLTHLFDKHFIHYD